MKKNVLISAVLAAALLPAVGMSAEKVNSFVKNGQYCDSWAWQDGDQQSNNKQNSAGKQSSKEKLAFGDDTHYGIGW